MTPHPCFDGTYNIPLSGSTAAPDQLPPPLGKGHDYGAGFLAHQWYGIKRLLRLR